MDVQETDSEVKEKQQELARCIDRLVRTDGTHPTAIPSLRLIRTSTVSEPLHTVHEPSLCVIAQGSKLLALAQETFKYDPASYMIASVHLPVCGQIIQASEDSPFLGIQLGISTDQVLDMMKETSSAWRGKISSGRGISVSKTKPLLLDVIIRLVRLLEMPQDIPVLAPLTIREILYRVLQDEQGDLVRQFAVMGSHAQCVARVIQLIHSGYDQPLRIEKLAKEVNMSPSSLHQYFKKVTAMSPIQYQKQLRLQEARRLLISESIDATHAAYKVGYESPSQFSREYARMFGRPPKNDVKQLQDSLYEKQS
ncbi:AraC family transcriptional regulator [Paenibacillus durus]|uniref:AraC family transcriptional regulator n=1 Tax=Paenibacillus durus ATCC 35681 TaxID=1333534 RepID=A0A0F7FDZ0_PAEDU|nr:AraC family transcriptional regulator [Paenibacillus durus]AKG37064.1 AraC family transcriptional regulator [Paenibacillus durus ATCC 35681]